LTRHKRSHPSRLRERVFTTRISTNRLNLQKKPVLLVDIITDALESVGPAMQAAGHALEIHMPEPPVVLDADLTRLAQVFGNLLSNSA
jgi:signal transduction histidine kinase